MLIEIAIEIAIEIGAIGQPFEDDPDPDPDPDPDSDFDFEGWMVPYCKTLAHWQRSRPLEDLWDRAPVRE